METSNETRGSALQYAASLKAPVAMACTYTTSARTKHNLKSGKISGISFPDSEAKIDKRTLGRKTYTNKERIAIVKAIDARRDAGEGLMSIVEDYGTTSQTYGKWKLQLNVGKKYGLSQDQHDQEILDLVNSGMSITDACAKFGVCRSVWGQRSVKNGLRRSTKRLKMTRKHIDLIELIKAEIATGAEVGKTVEKHGLTYSQYRNYSERMKF